MAQCQTDKFIFECSMDQYNGIHRALDKVRSTSKSVNVDKDALAKLLVDHGKLLNRYKIEG